MLVSLKSDPDLSLYPIRARDVPNVFEKVALKRKQTCKYWNALGHFDTGVNFADSLNYRVCLKMTCLLFQRISAFHMNLLSESRIFKGVQLVFSFLIKVFGKYHACKF